MALNLCKSKRVITTIKVKNEKANDKTSLIQYSAFALWLWGVRAHAAKAF